MWKGKESSFKSPDEVSPQLTVKNSSTVTWRLPTETNFLLYEDTSSKNMKISTKPRFLPNCESLLNMAIFPYKLRSYQESHKQDYKLPLQTSHF